MNYILNLRLITIFMSLLIFVSCHKHKNKLEMVNGTPIPWKTGYSWTYERRYDESMKVDTFVKQVGDYVNKNGYYGYSVTFKDAPYHTTFITDNDSDGNFVSIGAYSDKDSIFAPSILYKRNTFKGDSWYYNNIYGNINGIFAKRSLKVTCINTNSTIITPLGKFKCKTYQTTNDSYKLYFVNDYVSDSVGLVKSEEYFNNKLTLQLVLVKYNIKN